MIGIIGGNGVAATNRLQVLIENMIVEKGAFRDAHHPEMLIYQATQAPSRSMYLEDRGPSFLEYYIKAGLKMKDFGCTELCMCCNTAHFFIEELQQEIGLPFVNIIELVAKEVKKQGLKKVGIMCSDGCRRHKLYNKYFALYTAKTEILYPPLLQYLVTRGICNAKNSYRRISSPIDEQPMNCFDKVIEELKGEGCDGIIAGCTDINNVYHYIRQDIAYIDSLQVLASYIVEKNEFWSGNIVE